jgi:hypothetical protein
MAIKTLLVSLVVMIALIAGCGGGGGGNLTPPALDDDVRQMQPGDRWVYTVTGTATDGSGSIAVIGTLTKTVTSNEVTVPDPVDAPARVVTWSGTVAGVGYSKSLSTEEYLTQDTDGSIWTYGGKDAGGVYWIVSPVTGRNQYVWSPLATGREWGSHEETSDGLSFDRNFEVIETATITVPAGVFETYRVTGTGLFAGSPSEEEVWWAPQIGAPAQHRIEALDSDTDKMLDLTLKLASWNR